MEGTPNIVSIEGNAYKCSVDEINYYLRLGFAPKYDSAGGSMAKFINNLSRVDEVEIHVNVIYPKHLQTISSQK